MTPGDGSAAVPSEPRRWTLRRCDECGQGVIHREEWQVPLVHGAGCSQRAANVHRVTVVEEVGPVSEAQETLAAGLRGLAAMVDDYFRGKYEDEPVEGDPACHLWNAANAVMEEPGAIQTWLYAEHEPSDDDDAERALIAAGAVLSAAREVKSDGD